ncbi:TraM recognition domain-containing protein [Gordonia polyisoprenivorans]
MGALWSASTCRIIGAGLQEATDTRMVSNLIGTHEVWKTSYSSGPGGNTRSRQLIREPIMPLEEVAAMDRSHALLIRQWSRPALMELMPWYLEDEATDISTYQKTATEQVRRSAVSDSERTRSVNTSPPTSPTPRRSDERGRPDDDTAGPARRSAPASTYPHRTPRPP